MTSIDAKEAASALSDIDSIVRRVRQSRIYDVASKITILSGIMVFAGNLATWAWPHYGGYIWVSVNALNVVVCVAVSLFGYRQTGVRTFDLRMLAAFLLFFAFGLLCSVVLGHFGPRQMGTFWPIYFMLFYMLAGLWIGPAFTAIGLGITVLTLIGYFFVGGFAFLLWMAVVNGVGLVVGGLWMRRS
ncbi:MAG TPA: hypothetical protein VN065_15900 [Bradyrhizobium sp.]|jgi:hypothetical protein|nr:hypothetical protein [Bradyrhizobium sp.]